MQQVGNNTFSDHRESRAALGQCTSTLLFVKMGPRDQGHQRLKIGSNFHEVKKWPKKKKKKKIGGSGHLSLGKCKYSTYVGRSTTKGKGTSGWIQNPQKIYKNYILLQA